MPRPSGPCNPVGDHKEARALNCRVRGRNQSVVALRKSGRGIAHRERKPENIRIRDDFEQLVSKKPFTVVHRIRWWPKVMYSGRHA